MNSMGVTITACGNKIFVDVICFTYLTNPYWVLITLTIIFIYCRITEYSIQYICMTIESDSSGNKEKVQQFY